MCALRALILCLRLMAVLVVVFGIGGWLVITLAGFLAPAAIPSNPTMNDLALYTFDLMPNVQTGYPELDRSMAAFRNLGRMEIPVRETATVFGLALSVLGLFRIVGSAILALLLWLIADLLDRRARRWEWEDDARESALFMRQYSNQLPAPPPAPDYRRSPNGMWDYPAPPKRVWTPKEPYSREPTPLDLYLKRKGRR